MTSRTDKMSAGNSRAAYMREYNERKRLEKQYFNNIPKRPTLNAERQSEYKETYKNLSPGFQHSIDYCNECNEIFISACLSLLGDESYLVNTSELNIQLLAYLLNSIMN
jgi:hypothetical protein